MIIRSIFMMMKSGYENNAGHCDQCQNYRYSAQIKSVGLSNSHNKDILSISGNRNIYFFL